MHRNIQRKDQFAKTRSLPELGGAFGKIPPSIWQPIDHFVVGQSFSDLDCSCAPRQSLYKLAGALDLDTANTSATSVYRSRLWILMP